jgi:hypothetical protein
MTGIIRTAGVIYVIYGSSSLPSKLYVDTMTAQHSLKITSSVGSYAGVSLSDAGDVNGDGYDDLLIGSVPYTNGFGIQKSYLIFGRKIDNSCSNISINLATLSVVNGLMLTGGGMMVSGVGDVTADGYADMVLVSYTPSIIGCNSFVYLYPEQRTAHPVIAPTSSPSIERSLSPSLSTITDTPTILVPTTFRPSITDKPTSLSTTFSAGTSPLPTNYRIPSSTNSPSHYLPLSSSSQPSITANTFLPTILTSKLSNNPVPTPYVNTFTPTIIPSRSITSNTATLFPTKCKSVLGTACTPYRVVNRRSTVSPTSIIRNTIIANSTDTVLMIIGTGESEIFVIDNTASKMISIRGNGGKDEYQVYPHKNQIINITDFNASIDTINLQAFSKIHSLIDLQFLITSDEQEEQIYNIQTSFAGKHTSMTSLSTTSTITVTIDLLTYQQTIILQNIYHINQLELRCFIFNSATSSQDTIISNQHIYIMSGIFLMILLIIIYYYRVRQKSKRNKSDLQLSFFNQHKLKNFNGNLLIDSIAPRHSIILPIVELKSTTRHFQQHLQSNRKEMISSMYTRNHFSDFKNDNEQDDQTWYSEEHGTSPHRNQMKIQETEHSNTSEDLSNDIYRSFNSYSSQYSLFSQSESEDDSIIDSDDFGSTDDTATSSYSTRRSSNT